MREYRHSNHATYEIQYHFVWITKYMRVSEDVPENILGI